MILACYFHILLQCGIILFVEFKDYYFNRIEILKFEKYEKLK